MHSLITEIICSLQYFAEVSKLFRFRSPQPLFPPQQQSPCNGCVSMSLLIKASEAGRELDRPESIPLKSSRCHKELRRRA